MIVAMTANVDVEDGLTNGATGVVKYTDYRMERTNHPSIIWVLLMILGLVFQQIRVSKRRTFILNYKHIRDPNFL